MTVSASLGSRGEAIAAKFYLSRGCRILAHNYRTRFGELDLVVEDGETTVICEVKTRNKIGRYGDPGSAVTPAKQQRILAAAAQYLEDCGRTQDDIRFDVIEILPLPEGKWQVHCIKNAFTA